MILATLEANIEKYICKIADFDFDDARREERKRKSNPRNTNEKYKAMNS